MGVCSTFYKGCNFGATFYKGCNFGATFYKGCFLFVLYMNIVLLSLFSTIIFGIIDAVFFLFFEETAQNKIKKLTHVSMNIAEIVTGSLSAAAAIFVAANVEISLEEEMYLIHHPLLDVSGILLGTLVVVLTYVFYIRYIRKTLLSAKKVY